MRDEQEGTESAEVWPKHVEVYVEGQGHLVYWPTPGMFTAEEATHVERPERGPWVWPSLVGVMVSDSFKVTGKLVQRAANGDPLQEAFAVTYLENLYRAGYAVVKLANHTDCGGDHLCTTVGGKCDACIEADAGDHEAEADVLRHAKAVLEVLGPVAVEANPYLAEAVHQLSVAIAKAEGPDLLVAAKRVRDTVSRVWGDGYSTSDDALIAIDAAVASLDTAIARAEGNDATT